MIARETTEDVQLDGVFIPKGVHIAISIATIHRHPKYWGTDAETFNPDHFLPENIEKRPAYAYLPFSHGIRNCIGWRYATYSIKSMLINLLMNYKFETPLKYDEIVYQSNVLLFTMESGYQVQIFNR